MANEAAENDLEIDISITRIYFYTFGVCEVGRRHVSDHSDFWILFRHNYDISDTSFIFFRHPLVLLLSVLKVLAILRCRSLWIGGEFS